MLAVVATDGFETADFQGGSGNWLGNWQASGSPYVTGSSSPQSGSRHALIQGSEDIQRSVDVSGLTDLRLSFGAKLSSFESSDSAQVEARIDGGNWTSLKQFVNGEDDGQYDSYDYAVPGEGSTLDVRFNGQMSSTRWDYWFVDDVQVSGTPSGPVTYDGAVFGGSFYRLTTSPLDWESAENQAVARGGHLVAINSFEEQEFLEDSFLVGTNAGDPHWIGLTDQVVEDDFRWTSGDPVTYTNWLGSEPNNNGSSGEDYVAMNWGALQGIANFRGRWNDTPLSGTEGPYYGITEEPAEGIAIDDVSMVEGDSGTSSLVFTVTRYGDLSDAATVNWATEDGTAISGTDYVSASGTLVFASNDIQKTIAITVNGDVDLEEDEQFYLNLSAVAGADVLKRQGMASLVSNEFPAPVGLISHWSAEGNALDVAGDNDATIVSGTTYAQGQVGSAFSFDGVDDKIVVPDSPSLELTRSLTIESWVRIDSFREEGDSFILFRGDSRSGLDPYRLTAHSSGEITFGISSLTAGKTLRTPVQSGEFVYVVATLDDDSGEMKIYLNGLLRAQTTTDVRPFGPLDPFSNPGIGIGNSQAPPGTTTDNPFNGAIDELKLYDVALSEAEILASFYATKGNLLPSVSIRDTTVIEGDERYRLTDSFVTAASGGLTAPRGVAFGLDDNLYVASGAQDSILRYNGVTGEFMDTFVAPGTEGLDFPWDIEFHNGDLFVVSSLTNSVLRFDGVDGTFIDEFISADDGRLESPRGLLFGTNNDLYVTSCGEDDAIHRYNASTGDWIEEFIESGDGGLNNPTSVDIGPSGDFFVSSTNATSSSILRYDASGDFVDTFIASGSGGLNGPAELMFDDDAGLLLVASNRSDNVVVYDSVTGDVVDTFDASVAGLDAPIGFAVDDQGRIYVGSSKTNQVLRFTQGSFSGLEVQLSNAWPEAVTVQFSTINGEAVAGNDYVATAGEIRFASGETRLPVVIPIITDAISEPTEAFTVALSGASNAQIDDAEGTVTITELEFSVNDPVVFEGESAGPLDYASAGIDGSNFNALTFGPDGDLYVGLGGDADGLQNSVMRYDGLTGGTKGIFVNTSNLATTRDLLFRDGKLYVADLGYDDVRVFDANTGAMLGIFVGDDPDTTSVDESGGLVGPEGLVFGPDGNGDGVEDLYVTGWRSNNVIRYDGLTGELIGTFATGITAPHGIEYSSGRFYVTSHTNEIFELDSSGTLLRTIGSSADGLSNPIDIAIGPDDGLLYVTSGSTSKVVRYDLATGQYVDDFATAADGLDYTRSLTFHQGALYVTSKNHDDVIRFGTRPEIVFDVSIAGPIDRPVHVDFSTGDISAQTDLDYLPRSGTITFDAGETARRVILPIVDDAVAEPDETFAFVLSNASVGAIAKATGIGTILNDDIAPNMPPVANAGGNYSATEGLSVTLTGAGSSDSDGTIVNYEWDLDNDGDFDDASGISPSFTPLLPGLLTIGLRVTDNDGDTSVSNATVNVTNVAATADAGGPYFVDEGASITLDASASTEPGNHIVSFLWDIDGDGFDDGTGATLGYSNTSDGVYNVSVRVTDDGGSIRDAATTVTVNNVAPTANAGGPYSTEVGIPVLLTAASSMDPGNDIVSYEWDLDGNGSFEASGVATSFSSSIAGDFEVALKVTDDDGASSTTAVNVSVNAVPTGPNLSFGEIRAVGSSWENVALDSSYTSMVVVATPRYNPGSAPGVVRITNVTANSFDVRVDNVGEGSFSGGVHYVVIEEGVYDQPGYKLEAIKYTEAETSGKNAWSIDSASYQQTYVNPVVVGQVMSANDPQWSVFWASSGSRTSPPSSSQLNVGKHVAEDPTSTRLAETIGYVVIEATQSGNIEGLPFVAGVGGDSVRGVGNGTYEYRYEAMDNSEAAVLSSAGMDGGDGGWPVLYGDNPLPYDGDTIGLVIDEDQLGDNERNHTTEQVAYFVIDPPKEAVANGVEADFAVTPFDALKVINRIARIPGDDDVIGGEDDSLDFNGDGVVTAIDALMVINRLSGKSDRFLSNASAEFAPAMIDQILSESNQDDEDDWMLDIHLDQIGTLADSTD